jgi:chemotaxis family two-component system sensor kinase Cph1
MGLKRSGSEKGLSVDLGFHKSMCSKFVCLGLLFVMFFLGSASPADDSVTTVKVGVYQNFPLVFIDGEGAAKGVFIDLIEGVAREEGWKIEYVKGTWAECLSRGTNGGIDLITSIMHTKERESFLDFPESNVVNMWGQVYVGLESDIQTVFELRDKTVGLLKNGANGLNFKRLVEEYEIECNFREYDSYDEMETAIFTEAIDAGVFFNVHGYKYEESGGIKQTGVIFNPTQLKFATAKGTNKQVLEAIDRYFLEWKSDKASPYYKALDTWFQLSVKEVVPDWISKVIYGVGGVLIIVISFVFILRHQVRLRTNELSQSRERFKTLTKSSPVGIFQMDTKGDCIYVNDRWCEIAGMSPEEAASQEWKKGLHVEDRQAILDGWEKFVDSGERFELEYRIQTPEGSIRWVQACAIHLRGRRGEVVGSIGSVADITERKSAEAEREGLLKALEARNKELQSILYSATHDLKSPLVNIRGFGGELMLHCQRVVELLKKEEFDEEAKLEIASLAEKDIPESFGFIDSGALKINTLLDGLLETSRVGNSEIKVEKLEMNDMLQSIVESMELQIDETKAKVEVGGIPDCMGDANQVDRVFTNLIDNALKYHGSEHQCCIEVDGEIKDDMCVYFVKDNGVGIHADYHGKVFELFHRLSPASGAKGEGLGLTIASRIVDRLDGRMWVESEVDKGCKFFVALPKG